MFGIITWLQAYMTLSQSREIILTMLAILFHMMICCCVAASAAARASLDDLAILLSDGCFTFAHNNVVCRGRPTRRDTTLLGYGAVQSASQPASVVQNQILNCDTQLPT